MKLKKLPVVAAISAVLCFVACSDEKSPVAGPENEALNPGLSSSSGEFLGNEALGNDVSSSSSVVSGNGVPSSGDALPASSNGIPGPQVTSSGIGASSSSGVVPGNGASSSSVKVPSSNPSGNGEDGDDENDNEDARTLNGTQILLKVSGTTATVENNNGCVEVADKSATITCPGAYYVTGESSDFQVVVNTPAAENEGNTGIYLHNATLKSSNSPILVKNADKAVIHLVKGTTNVLEDGNGSHAFTNVGGKPDTSKAVIYAKDDMNIKGAGKLTVKGNFMNGIQSTNDLKIKNGDITVQAKDDGIKGKGSLQISGGTLNITVNQGDGLESNECEKNNRDSCINIVEGKGFVEISGGNITIKGHKSGIKATNYILVSDSTEPSTIKIESPNKGISAEKNIYINGGTIDVKSDSSSIRTNWEVHMNGGNVTISTKKKGIHADSALYLSGSTINVVTSFEAIEAYKIYAEGGVTSVFATNDGWNGGGGPKNNNSSMAMFSESSGYITITGGYHYISVKGNMVDGLDANGTGKMTGGVVIVEITGESYESSGMGGMGGFNMGGMGFGGQQGGGNNCGAYNFAGGLIDTDDGFTITGGVLLAFGNYTMDVPGCAQMTYNNSSYYGSDKAAVKPTHQGNYILYGGEVQSVAQVQTSGMKEFKFPNGVSYMYK